MEISRTKLVVIMISSILLVSFSGAVQYINLYGEHGYEVDSIDGEQESLSQYMHKDGENRLTDETIGDSKTRDEFELDDSYDWTSEEMDESVSVNDLYTYLYLEPFEDFELKVDGTEGDESGWNVTTLDMNGDEHHDVVIGAPEYDNERGRLLIFFGSNLELDMGFFDPSDADVTITGASTGDRFGWSLSNASDWSGNGKDDLVVGAPGTGNAYVFEGWDGWNGTYDAGQDANFTLNGDGGDEFGFAVGGGADLTDDTTPEIFVGAPSAEGERGDVFVYEKSGGSAVLELTITGKHEGDRFGHSLAGIRSVSTQTGDWTDLLVGAPYANETGRAYVFYQGLTEGINLSKENADTILSGVDQGDKFGWSVFSAGDVNNDSYGDIVIGAPEAEETGRAYVYLGGDEFGGLLSDTDSYRRSDSEPDSQKERSARDISGYDSDENEVQEELMSSAPEELGEVLYGEHSEESRYGWNISYADIDGNGYNETIIGAPEHDHDGQEDVGAVYIFFGYEQIEQDDIYPGNANVTIYGTIPGGHFGWDVAGVGDVTDDGRPDVVVGAPHTDNGTVYVIPGSLINTIEDNGGVLDADHQDITEITGENAGDKFGASVSTAGGDDFVAGAWDAVESETESYGFSESKVLINVSDYSKIEVFMNGAGGGGGFRGTGGSGGYVEAMLNVSEFDELEIWVGEGGNYAGQSEPTAGGWGRSHGGDSGDGGYAGSGGGSTEIVGIRSDSTKGWLAAADAGGGGADSDVWDEAGRGGGARGGSGGTGAAGDGQDGVGDGFGGAGGDGVNEEEDGDPGGGGVNESYLIELKENITGGGSEGGDKQSDDAGDGDITITYYESTGRTYVFETLHTDAADADYILDGTSDGDMFGFSVAGGGDVDGDGNYDILVGAPGRDEAYLYYGPDFGTETTIYSIEEEEDFGWSLSFVDDFTGTGNHDVAVGAPGAEKGNVYLYSDEAISTAEDSILNETKADFTTTGSSLADNNPNNNVYATSDGELNLTRTQYIDDDFEDDTVGEHPEGWEVYEDGFTDIEVSDSQSRSGTKSVAFIDGSDGDYCRMINTFTEENRLEVEFSIYLETTGEFDFYGRKGEQDGPYLIWDDEYFYYYDGSRNSIDSHTRYTWYDIRLVIDADSDTYDIYVDGELEVAEAGFYESIDDIETVYFGTREDTDNDYDPVYIDDVKVQTQDTSGYYLSAPRSTEEDIMGVKYTWSTDEFSGTEIWVNISRDGGTTWNESALTENEWYKFPTEGPGSELVYNVTFKSDGTATPILYDIKIEYSFLSPEATIEGEATGDRFGYSLDAGDMDVDGDTDLIVGAPYNDGETSNGGRMYVFKQGDPIPGSAGKADYMWTGTISSGFTGWSVTHVGFIGDVDPIAVGSPGVESWRGNVTIVGVMETTVSFQVTTAQGQQSLSEDNAVRLTVDGEEFWIYDEKDVEGSFNKDAYYLFSLTNEYGEKGSDNTTYERWIRKDEADPHPPQGYLNEIEDEIIEVTYYHQYNVSVSTGGDHLSEETSTTLTYTNFTEKTEDIWDDKSPVHTWMDIDTSFNVEPDYIDGPSSPRDITYVCDDDEITADEPMNHTFLFHAEFPPDVTIHGPSQNSRFGWSVSGGNDLEKMGQDDVMIGAPRVDDETGRAYGFYGGGTDWEIGSTLTASDDANWSSMGETSGSRFGWTVHVAGDINGDNVSNLIVGAPRSDVNGENSGRTYIYGLGDVMTLDLEFFENEVSQGNKIAESELDADEGIGWYSPVMELVGSDIEIDAGDRIIFRMTATSGESFVTLVYGGPERPSRYVIGEKLGDARVESVETYKGDMPTQKWAAEYERGDEVTVRANVSASKTENITGARILIKDAHDNVLIERRDMDFYDEGETWKEFEYTFDSSRLRYDGRFVARVIAVDNIGARDEALGDTAHNTRQFQVREDGG